MFRDLLIREFTPFGPLSPGQIDALEAHYQLLVRWNERMNLTRIRKVEEMVRFHYCESLFLASTLPPGPLNVVDVGSGAGFPGFPIAICRPDLHVTLLESHQRKAVFLSQASHGLANLGVHAGRAEHHTGRFDWVVSRAVVPEDVISFHLAANLALLVGEAELGTLSGIQSIEKIPWGSGRFLVIVRDDRVTCDCST